MKKEKKKFNWQKFIYTFVFITMVASIVIIGIKIILAPSVFDPNSPYVRVKADYTLMFLQSILGVLCMLAPSFIERKMKIKIPSYMLIPFVIFLYCAIFLGETRSFYYTVPHWDTMLHTFSGGMLGALGFSIVSILNQNDKVPLRLSPAFIALFAFCFAVTLGVVWEIYEFTFDGVWGLNMQKFMLEDGTQLIGRAALADTMKDLIVDCVGAGIMSIFGYFSMKKHDKWLESVQLKKINSDKEVTIELVEETKTIKK